MTLLDKYQIRHLQQLCHICCTPEEEARFLQDLERILNYINQLQEINTENIETSCHLLSSLQANVLREDEVIQEFTREEFLSNAPQHIGGMIRIFPVMKAQE